MSLGQVHHIDIVADASTVGRRIVVAKDGELFTDSHGGLCHVGNEVGRNAIGQFTDECRRVSTDRIEIAQDDALDVGTAMNIVVNDLFVDFLGISVGRGSFLMRSVFCYRQIFRLGLTVDGTGRGEDDSFHVVLGHEFKQVHQ